MQVFSLAGQDFAALAVVFVAAIYLGRRLWPSASSQSGCASGCGGCPAGGRTVNAGGTPGLNSQVIPIDGLPWKTRAADGAGASTELPVH